MRKFHGQKVGFRLLKAYFDGHLGKGFSKGNLWVLRDNPTMRFYESIGARLTNDIKKSVIGGQNVEELYYVWDDISLVRRWFVVTCSSEALQAELNRDVFSKRNLSPRFHLVGTG